MLVSSFTYMLSWKPKAPGVSYALYKLVVPVEFSWSEPTHPGTYRVKVTQASIPRQQLVQQRSWSAAGAGFALQQAFYLLSLLDLTVLTEYGPNARHQMFPGHADVSISSMM